MKKFLIAIGSILGCLVIATIVVVSVLAAQTQKVDFKFNTPSRISVYNKTLNSTVFYDDDDNFNKIIETLNNGLKTNKLSQVASGNKLSKNIKVSPTGEWKLTMREQFTCIQLEYTTDQTLIAYDGQNTKSIKYKYLFLVLKDKNGMLEHELYYGENSAIYESTPLIITLNESGLKQYLTKNNK